MGSFALCSQSSWVCCRELNVALHKVYGTRRASPSVTQCGWLIVFGGDALGKLRRCSRCVTSLTSLNSEANFPNSRFPKELLPQRGSIIMCIWKSALLLFRTRSLLCYSMIRGYSYSELQVFLLLEQRVWKLLQGVYITSKKVKNPGTHPISSC